MKKIFTTLCLASLCLAAGAQDLTVTIDGKPVSNGDVITSSTVEAFEYNGTVMSWELKPEMKLVSEKGTDVTMTVTNLAGGSVKYADSPVDNNPTVSFCGVTIPNGVPGNCVPLAVGESSTQSQTLAAGVEGTGMLYFMSTNFANPVPEDLKASAAVKVVYGSETLEFTVNMVYSNDDSGVVGVASEGVDFKVVDGAVVADGDVEVYDLAGRSVKNADLNGVYVVRVAGKTAKVVVK